jgi:hypothetical protein
MKSRPFENISEEAWFSTTAQSNAQPMNKYSPAVVCFPAGVHTSFALQKRSYQRLGYRDVCATMEFARKMFI